MPLPLARCSFASRHGAAAAAESCSLGVSAAINPVDGVGLQFGWFWVHRDYVNELSSERDRDLRDVCRALDRLHRMQT